MHFLRTLGALSLLRLEGDREVELVSGSKTLLIPAWLATRPGQSARREHLAEFLWPDQERAGALRALRQGLFFLSRHAGDLFRKGQEVIALDPDGIRVDLLDFDDAVRLKDYPRALALYRGRFATGLERRVGVEVEHWIEEQNARLNIAIEVAHAHLISEALSTGDPTEAERLARSFLDDNPSDDRRHQVLIRTLKATGNEVGALRAFETYRTITRREEGEELPSDLKDTMERLRAELTAPRIADLGPAPAAATVRIESATGVPSAEDRPQPTPASTSRLRLALGGAIGVILVLAMMLLRSGAGDIAALQGLRAAVLVATDEDGLEGFREIMIRRGRLEVRELRTPFPPFPVPGPFSDVLAYAEEATDGWNAAVREGRKPSRTLTTFPGDEFPLTWSPDGRFLLLTRAGHEVGNRTRVHTLYFFDLAGDSLHALIELGRTTWPQAAWSPDGTQIAFTADVAGSPDVFVMDFDGSNLRNLTRHHGSDQSPAWAPDRSAIAFVSTREGSADLYLIRPDGSDLRPLTRLTGDEALPVWLSPSVLLFLAGGDQPEFWTLDAAGGRAARIELAPRIARIVAATKEEPSWLDRVRIRPRPEVGSPGQHITLTAEAMSPRDGRVMFGNIPLRWTSLDTMVARIGPDGALELRAEGTARIRVTAGGWRSDSLSFAVRPLTVAGGEPLFEEGWHEGLDTTKWRPFGEPRPQVFPARSRADRPAFANSGDEFFESGAVTVEPFDLRRGLTVEVDGRVPFTGQLRQIFGFQLVPETTSDSALAYGRAGPIVALRLTGSPDGGGSGEAAVLTGRDKQLLPIPGHTGAWRTYILQITPEGIVQFLLDGRLYWQSVEPLPRSTLGQARLALGFSSVGTRILHGAVRIYPGPRYLLLSPDNPR